MKKLYRWICKVEETICGIGFIGLVAFVFISAILRGFKFSMSWSIDMAMLLLAWTAFLGADIAWRNNQIVGVDLLVRYFPKKLRLLIELVVYLIILVALVVMVVFGIRLAWTERVAKYQSMPIPKGLVTYSLIIASFSMIFSTLVKIRRVGLELTVRDQVKVEAAE